ncbi:MAG TPA: FAD:protein FMN transferase [Polyangia bacterium]|jgi:thiamine biosynthesis lipoprotein|nr:FAD:protein FMN transferase [Polyangia bacterium]
MLVSAVFLRSLTVAALLMQASPPTTLPPPPTAAAPSAVAPGARVHARTVQVMGTDATFSIWTDDQARAERAFELATDEIRRIEHLMTDWDRPGQDPSDIVRINKAAGKKAVRVSDETLAVIDKSLEMSRHSDGAFDITFAVMHGLWKFDEDLERKVPPDAEIAARRKLINYRDVIVDHAASTVKLRRVGMRVGLGGIAKGYAVDRCADVIRAQGLTNFMVQAGGDLFVAGQKGAVNWMVGVRDPRGGPRDIIAKMPIKDHAFSTAGDYERSFILGGKRYHHIIDPKTGYPAMASRGVTIFAPTAFLADALDDAVFILGPEKGLALVASYPGCAALIVDGANKVWMSPSLEGVLQRTGAPTDGI